MSLTIEDGSVVADAESYATVEELRAYASKRAASLPVGDDACEALLIKACDYLQSMEDRFQGMRTAPDQALAWPRDGVFVNGRNMPSDEIPADIKSAQMQLAIDAQTVDLQPTINAAAQTGPVIEETVDVLSVKYAQPTTQLTASVFAKANGLLAKFYRAGWNSIRVVRS